MYFIKDEVTAITTSRVPMKVRRIEAIWFVSPVAKNCLSATQMMLGYSCSFKVSGAAICPSTILEKTLFTSSSAASGNRL